MRTNPISQQLFSVLSVTAASLCFACGGTEPTPEEYDDVATDVAAMTSEPGGEADLLATVTLASRGDIGLGLVFDTEGHLSGRLGEINFDIELSCEDESGMELQRCDERTDEATWNADLDGRVKTNRYEASFERHAAVRATNLSGEVANLDGEGSLEVRSEFDAIFRDEHRTFMLSYDARYEDVKVATHDGAVVGGTIHYDIDAKRTRTNSFEEVEREIQVKAELKIVAEGTAELTLDGKHQYRINTRSGEVEAMGEVTVD